MSSLQRSRVLILLLTVMVLGLVDACSTTIPSDYRRTISTAWDHPADTRLGRAFASELEQRPGQSGLHLLWTGQDAFAARVALAEMADHTLDLQYYMIRDDDSTNTLLSRVAAAAERGVRVRLLVDDIYAAGKDFDLAALSGHPNIEVRVFNPFLARGPLGVGRMFEMLGNINRLNRRMHNKLFVADNAAAVIGGRNLGNEYFGAEVETGFVDLDALAVGPVVQQVSTSFDTYWASEWAIPIEVFAHGPPDPKQTERVIGMLREIEQGVRRSEFSERVRTSGFANSVRSGRLDFGWGRAHAVYDRPDKLTAERKTASTHIGPQIRPLFEAARSDVAIVSPYFIPGDEGVRYIAALRQKGVQVRVITNSLAGNDVMAVYAGYAKYREPLLHAGVEIYELRPMIADTRQQGQVKRTLGFSRASLHAKAFVIDHRHVFIGSMNMDPRSAMLNTEIGVVIDSPALAREMLALYETLASPLVSYRLGLEDGRVVWVGDENGQQVRYTTAPEASLWRRFLTGIMSVFAPEELL